MSLNVPLWVRIETGQRDRHVTRYVSGLSFRSTVPGGFESAELSLNKPLRFTPEELDLFAFVTIGHGVEVLWEGRVENLGKTAGSSGEVWSLSPVGPMSHANDITRPYVSVDARTQPWQEGVKTQPGGSYQTKQEESTFRPYLELRMDDTAYVRSGIQGVADVYYPHLFESGQHVGRIGFKFKMGYSEPTPAWMYMGVGVYSDLNFGTGNVVRTYQFDASQELATQLKFGVDYGLLRPIPRFWIFNNRASFNVPKQVSPPVGTHPVAATDIGPTDPFNPGEFAGRLWAAIFDPIIVAVRYFKDGTMNTSYVRDFNYSFEIVEDLLGNGRLPQFDGKYADVQQSGTKIYQFAFPDPVSVSQLLEELMALEPAYYWAAWERSTFTGKYRFEWVPWPTTVRYELSTVDGYSAAGASAEGIYNKVAVRWKDSLGRIKTTYVTNPVQVLTDAGLTREASIDLGDVTGNAAMASEAGLKFLQEHAQPQNAGQITVARKILDRYTGRTVEPYELKPGGLVRVRDLPAYPDSLNNDVRDGATVFRAVSVEYDSDSNTATIELDSFPPDIAQAIADLNTKIDAKRRR